MRYGWHHPRAADADAVGEFLGRVEQQHGRLTPALVVEAARPNDSPLHEMFEWDDGAAAERWREIQARQLLRAVVIEVPTVGADSVITRAYVNVVEDEGRGYVGLYRAMSDEEIRKQVVERAWRELEAVREKYRHIEELAAVFEAMDQERRSA